MNVGCMLHVVLGNQFSHVPLQVDTCTSQAVKGLLCCHLPGPNAVLAPNQQGSSLSFPRVFSHSQNMRWEKKKRAACLSIPTELPWSHSQFPPGRHCMGDSPANSSMKAPLACGVHVFIRKSFRLAKISPFRLQQNVSNLSQRSEVNNLQGQPRKSQAK